MNIAFFGSPDIAQDILESIHTTYPVSLVVSQPDKPVGRKKVLTPTPVSAFAAAHNIPLKTPASLIRDQSEESPLDVSDFDIVILVAYGEIIPQDLLNQPKHGFINVHYSLLPKYRGASPVQAAILNGDTTTGVTIMQMDAELDHGDIISQTEVAIDISDTTASLLNKLTDAAKPLIHDMIAYVADRQALPETTPQDHEQATFCGRIQKQDAFVEFSDVQTALKQPGEHALMLHNKIRAYYPWPMVWTILPDGKRCKIIRSHIDRSGGIHDALIITEIQIEGKERTRENMIIDRLFSVL